MRKPLVLAALLLACGDPGHTEQVRPISEDPQIAGDDAYREALAAYGSFDTPGAFAKVTAALASNPSHPRALAAGLLFAVDGADRAQLAQRSKLATTTEALLHKRGESLQPPDRALLQAALFAHKGKVAPALDALQSEHAVIDYELAFWRASLAYRAGDYAQANRGYHQLLRSTRGELRGRIYADHIRVLLHFGHVDAALASARAYRTLLPARADAAYLQVRALLAANRLDEANKLIAELEARHPGDVTAGLGALLAARRGQFRMAATGYARAVAVGSARRRASYLAAQGLMEQLAGDRAAATATWKRCLADSSSREGKPLCVWLEAMRAPELDEQTLHDVIERVGTLSAGLSAPELLQALLQSRALLPHMGCLLNEDRTPQTAPPAQDRALELQMLLRQGYFFRDLPLPLFASITTCQRAAVTAVTDADQAVELLTAQLTTQPLLAVPLAALQLVKDPAAAAKTLDGVIAALPQLDREAPLTRVITGLRKRVTELNARPKPSN